MFLIKNWSINLNLLAWPFFSSSLREQDFNWYLLSTTAGLCILLCYLNCCTYWSVAVALSLYCFQDCAIYPGDESIYLLKKNGNICLFKINETTGAFEEELKVDNSAKHAVSFLVHWCDHTSLKNVAAGNCCPPFRPRLAQNQTVNLKITSRGIIVGEHERLNRFAFFCYLWSRLVALFEN